MKRLVAKLAGWGVVISLVGVAATDAPAATKGVRIRAASEAVQEALQCEVSGEDEKRQELLQSALEHVPDFPPALWQSGHVKHQNRWMRFDELPELLDEDPRLAEYRHRRENAPGTVDGQLTLARWCAQHKLDDRARAHLTAALEIDPENPQARQLLGFRKVDGAWLSQKEIQEAAFRAQRLQTGLQQWKPRLEEILRGLDHRSERQREQATKGLEAIDDPSAAPAIELVLAMRDEQTALLAVGVLDRLRGPDAALALARQAVLSPCEPVRDAATTALVKRDPVEYAPSLLAAMTTPVQTRANLYRTPNGRLMYRHALYREGQEQAELAVFETEYRRTVLWADDPASWQLRRQELESARLQDAAIKARALQLTAAQQNALIHQLNDRVCRVLSRATGQNLPPDPQAWWNWWNEHNEVFVEGSKPLKQAYHRDTVVMNDPRPPTPEMPDDGQDDTQATRPAPSPMKRWAVSHDGIELYRDAQGFNWAKYRWGEWRRLTCLLADTPVWTEAGLKPIAEIRIGDRVLAQNPATGELAYKPVLKTTLRPPARLLKIVFGDEALQCSGGHPFWIAGQGWVFARDLKEGVRLHAVNGTAAVRSVHPTGTEELHNLVVADFHTYFVTEAKILTHDNTIREPTDALVPGLVEPSAEPASDANDPSGLITGLPRP